eukprot:scaffold692_cov326-Prasinococcus_capsulatus_cf.AAC.8
MHRPAPPSLPPARIAPCTVARTTRPAVQVRVAGRTEGCVTHLVTAACPLGPRSGARAAGRRSRRRGRARGRRSPSAPAWPPAASPCAGRPRCTPRPPPPPRTLPATRRTPRAPAGAPLARTQAPRVRQASNDPTHKKHPRRTSQRWERGDDVL